ncbi:MAG: gamma-glutamylcyclotransferase [Gemmatimonadetes bacterium]|nr:gamma-glutamylcyclotransferase [Gemmatimonadota bacterium]
MPLYFAYGSNLSRRQMQERCPGARALYRARIPHHRLGFTGASESWGGGTATIVLAPGEDLWGAVYEVDEECLETLGAREGLAYALSQTECLQEDGGRLRPYLFVKVRDLEERPPSERYVEVIRRGFEDWGLDPRLLDRAVDRSRHAEVDSGG